MKRSIRDNTKKIETRGRKKTTGPGELIGVRLQPAQLSALDAWARSQADSPSRPEAIRRLLAGVLGGERVGQPRHHGARQASDLASREVEHVKDRLASADDQAHRKRALIRGPKEFREIRGDQPKTKK
jgi:hypothetical protein